MPAHRWHSEKKVSHRPGQDLKYAIVGTSPMTTTIAYECLFDQGKQHSLGGGVGDEVPGDHLHRSFPGHGDTVPMDSDRYHSVRVQIVGSAPLKLHVVQTTL
eukprot:4555749-Alexandrium_andersonii.AAC.1